MKKYQIALIFLIVNVSCSDELIIPEPWTILSVENHLKGKWQAYERGYSPGAGYIVDEIPDSPAQTIELKSGNHFTSNMNGLTDYPFYYLIENKDTGEVILALFKSLPKKELAISQLDHSYVVTLTDGNLILSFRYCIEGCHLGFKKT